MTYPRLGIVIDGTSLVVLVVDEVRAEEEGEGEGVGVGNCEGDREEDWEEDPKEDEGGSFVEDPLLDVDWSEFEDALGGTGETL